MSKIGRNKEKCRKYREHDTRAKNKTRRLAKRKQRLEKARIMASGA